MAATRRSSALVRTSGRAPSVVVVRNPPARRSTASRVGSRVGSAAAQAAMSEKHTLAALAAAGVAALARKNDWNLPTFGDVPPVLAWGLGAWAYGKFGKNKMAQHVATGLLSVGLYEQIAYTRDTRAAIDQLLTAQRAAEEAEDAAQVTEGVYGDFGG